jgi:hypothetical protein
MSCDLLSLKDVQHFEDCAAAGFLPMHRPPYSNEREQAEAYIKGSKDGFRRGARIALELFIEECGKRAIKPGECLINKYVSLETLDAIKKELLGEK